MSLNVTNSSNNFSNPSNQVVPSEKEDEAEKNPTLWQRFKLKAQQLSQSTSAFAKRHPNALKAAVVVTAVAVIATVFFASRSSATSDGIGRSSKSQPQGNC